MLVLISPAKNMAKSERKFQTISQPIFQNNANELVRQLQQLQKADLQKMMKVSADLATLNNERYLNWQQQPQTDTLKQALLYFQGMVFVGLDADTLSDNDLQTSQNQLRILSGLYGLLRPLDGIQAYRLEMGTTWQTENFKNLYDYWGSTLTQKVNETVGELGHKFIVNLASNEYFKAIKKNELEVPVITPIFKDNRGKGYQTIAVYAKKARGLMTRFIIQNQLTNPNDLQAFDSEGYFYNHELSQKNKPVFTRDH